MSLYLAEQAVDHVRNTVRMRANNRAGDRTDGEADVPGARMEGFRRGSDAPNGWQAWLAAEVGAYEELRAGNCLEMAKVAFVYLAKAGIRPIEIASFQGDAARVRLFGSRDESEVEPDHSFVVIGRSMGATERRERKTGVITMPALRAWPFGAVVCDPWARRCYLAHRLEVETQMLNRVTAGNTTLVWEEPFWLDVGKPWTG